MPLPGYFWDRWPYFACKLSWDITTTQVNSALHPSGVAKSSTSFCWGKGWKVTTAGWQVTHMACAFRSDMVISITNCYIRFTYWLTNMLYKKHLTSVYLFHLCVSVAVCQLVLFKHFNDADDWGCFCGHHATSANFNVFCDRRKYDNLFRVFHNFNQSFGIHINIINLESLNKRPSIWRSFRVRRSLVYTH